MKTATVLILAIFSQTVGDVLLTRGMKLVASTASQAPSGALPAVLQNYLDVAIQAARSPEVIVGTLCLIAFFVLYSAALSWADLSFVLPATAFGYVLNVAAGHYFLGERVSSIRWAGALIITLGVVVVSRSGVRAIVPSEMMDADTAGEEVSRSAAGAGPQGGRNELPRAGAID